MRSAASFCLVLPFAYFFLCFFTSNHPWEFALNPDLSVAFQKEQRVSFETIHLIASRKISKRRCASGKVILHANSSQSREALPQAQAAAAIHGQQRALQLFCARAKAPKGDFPCEKVAIHCH